MRFLMVRLGVHPKIALERLGHPTISITSDMYGHVLPGIQEAAAIRFDESLQETMREERRVKTRCFEFVWQNLNYKTPGMFQFPFCI